MQGLFSASGLRRRRNGACRGPREGLDEVVQLSWTVYGSSLKKLLMRVIRGLVADTGVQSVVIVVVKISGRAGLGIG